LVSLLAEPARKIVIATLINVKHLTLRQALLMLRGKLQVVGRSQLTNVDNA
jgi:hypothetical protein